MNAVVMLLKSIISRLKDIKSLFSSTYQVSLFSFLMYIFDQLNIQIVIYHKKNLVMILMLNLIS